MNNLYNHSQPQKYGIQDEPIITQNLDINLYKPPKSSESRTRPKTRNPSRDKQRNLKSEN